MNRSKYLNKIVEEVSQSKIKIILPEFEDERVKAASEILKSIGLNVLDISTINLNALKFDTNNLNIIKK